MKNILINIVLFILFPIAFLLIGAFILCGDVSLLIFLVIDIVLILIVIFSLNKKINESNS